MGVAAAAQQASAEAGSRVQVPWGGADWSSSAWGGDYGLQSLLSMSLASSTGNYFPQFPMPDSLLLPDVLPSQHACPPLLTENQIKVKEQVEFYLSDANLCQDAFFHGRLLEAEGGWLDARLVLDCARMKRLGASAEDIRQSLCYGGSLLLEAAEWPDIVSGGIRLYIRRLGGAPPPPLMNKQATAAGTATPRKSDDESSNMESPMSAANTDVPTDRDASVKDGSQVGSEDLRFGDLDYSSSPASATTTCELSPSTTPFLLKLSEVLPFFPETPTKAASMVLASSPAASQEKDTISEGARAGAELLKCLKGAAESTTTVKQQQMQTPEKKEKPSGVKRAKNGQPRNIKRI
jgi:hypothetical protein